MALLEIAGPEDGKLSAYVKKSVCLSEASFTDFSKLGNFPRLLEDRPRLFAPFVAMTKGGIGYLPKVKSWPRSSIADFICRLRGYNNEYKNGSVLLS